MADRFDRYIDRNNTNCAKYDEMNLKFGSDILHCAVADMDYQSPPAIIERLKEVVEHGVFGYTVLPENYQQLVVDWMQKRYDTQTEAEWVVFSPRINMAMNMIVETLTEKGDRMIVFTPAYPAFVNAVIKNERVLLESPLKNESGIWEMDLDALEEQMDDSVKIFFLCNPHNPTGRVWKEEELRRVGEFCLKHGLLLVSDDIHADFVREKSRYQTIWNVVPKLLDQTIILNSFTKTFNVPGIILSNMIIPNTAIREAVKCTIDRWGLHNPNIFAAAIMEPAYTRCEGWLKDVNEYLTENVKVVTQYIERNMPMLDAYCPEGTYMMWISYKKMNISEREMEDIFLKEGKISVYWGSHFGVEWSGYFRLNIASTRNTVMDIMERIKKACEKSVLI